MSGFEVNEHTLGKAADWLTRGAAQKDTPETVRKQRDTARARGNNVGAAWHNFKLFRYDVLEPEAARSAPEDYAYMFERSEFKQARNQLKHALQDVVRTAAQHGLCAARLPDLDTIRDLEIGPLKSLHIPRRGALTQRVMRIGTELGMQAVGDTLLPQYTTGDPKLDAHCAVGRAVYRFIELAQANQLVEEGAIGTQDAYDMLVHSIATDVDAAINQARAKPRSF